MHVIHSPLMLPSHYPGCVVALGNFDGLHRGHQSIIKKTALKAKELNLPAAVMTFEPHPRGYFNPNAPKLKLMRLRDKISMLETLGTDLLFITRFDTKLAATSAETFVDQLLVRQLRAKYIITGENFHFGKDRAGNAKLLKEKAAQAGFTYEAAAAVTEDGVAISSSLIRDALARGDIKAATHYLGHPFLIHGHVIHGDKRGRTLGFPTANLRIGHLYMPKFGVYAIKASYENQVYNGVANIGIRPTFGGKTPLLEAHLFNFDGELYGKRLIVELCQLIREEQSFESIEAMTIQLNRDMEKAEQTLSV